MPKILPHRALLAILCVATYGIALAVAVSADDGKSSVLQAPPSRPARSSPCNRDCLRSFVDKYFDALSSRCPCSIALAPGVKYTENGQLVKPGEGIWKTFTGRGKYRVYLADPANGEAGYYGDFSEFKGTLFGVMALRLKVQDQRIVEVEAIVAREQLRPGSGGLGANTAGVMTPRMIDELKPSGFISPDTLFSTSDAAKRTTRDQLIATTDRYFEGFNATRGSIVPFAERCSRRENGIAATDNPDGPVVDPAQPSFRVFSQSCRQELETGFFSALMKVRDVRQLVVDAEHGLVLNLAFFDNEGDVKSVSVPGVGRVSVPSEFLRPITYLVPQLFKIENGKIRKIEGLAWPVPYGMSSGWDK